MKLENQAPASHILSLIHKKDSAFWSNQQKENALKLFHQAAKNVPAYKNFLKQHRINPENIKTWKDFQEVPFTDKKSYLRSYPIEKLSWQGNLNNSLTFAVTSGSTGEPFYFPRTKQLDWEYSVLVEMFLNNSSYKTQGPVLVIIGFGMGVWIGGMITYKAFEMAAQRSKIPISIVTPGINKEEIFSALKKLAPHYKETVLVAYPPFLKDLLDEAEDRGINLKKLNLRTLTAAEAYSEKFRDYIVKKAHIKNLFLDTLNIYGTADMGAMAWETPVSILIRRLTSHNKKLFYDIFTKINKTPTLAQYNPLFINFESIKGEIILTGNNAIPSIRYALGDHGGAMTFQEMQVKLKHNGINLKKEAQKNGIAKHIYELPFVYVYERSDMSIKLYGAIIYPEHIRYALLTTSLSSQLTGKFTAIVKNNNKNDQRMEVNCELKKGKKSSRSLKKMVKEAIIRELLSKNSEYANNFKSIRQKIEPHVFLWPNQHAQYFSQSIKQKWIKK